MTVNNHPCTRPADGVITNCGFPFRGGPTDGVPPDPKMVALAQAYLVTCERVTLNSKKAAGSYGLKHRAEDWYRSLGRPAYISNGAMILAAFNLGIPVSRGPNSSRHPNARIAVLREKVDYR